MPADRFTASARARHTPAGQASEDLVPDLFETGTIYPSHPSYHNLPLLIKLRGDIAPAQLEAGLRMLITRHGALRTRIVSEQDQLFQIVDSAEQSKFQLELAATDDCGADGNCLIYNAGGQTIIGFRPLVVYLGGNSGVPQPALSTPTYLYNFFSKFEPYGNLPQVMKLDAEGRIH